MVRGRPIGLFGDDLAGGFKPPARCAGATGGGTAEQTRAAEVSHGGVNWQVLLAYVMKFGP